MHHTAFTDHDGLTLGQPQLCQRASHGDGLFMYSSSQTERVLVHAHHTAEIKRSMVHAPLQIEAPGMDVDVDDPVAPGAAQQAAKGTRIWGLPSTRWSWRSSAR